MTEQEFHDKLKQSVGSDGLSPDRQAKVLSAIRGERRKVCSWGKMKMALALGLILLLLTGGAVAGGRYLVDWQGEKLPDIQLESDQRMWQLKDWRMKGKWASIVKWDEERENYTGILAGTLETYASSLVQLRSWVKADGTLPWPENIPAGYEMSSGSVRYACGAEGEIKLRSQETTEDGYIISYFDMPKDHRFVAGYTFSLQNAERYQLLIQVTLTQSEGRSGLPMEDGSTFTELDVDGMLQAAAIESAGTTNLFLRRAVQPSLTYKTVAGYPDGMVKEWESTVDCLEIIIIGDGTPQELLDIFGLTAQ